MKEITLYYGGQCVMREMCLFIMVCSFGRFAFADGCMLIPEIDYNITGQEKVSSSAQKALLIWQDNKETLYLQSNYKGPATDFAWIIPVPDRPAVEQADWTIFEQAEEATRPKVKVFKKEIFGGIKCGCAAQSPVVTESEIDCGVIEMESLKIRELHIDIVSATDSGGFLRWLNNNKYKVSEKAEPVFKNYIDKNFYFVVVKISRTSEDAVKKGVSETVSGGLTPIKVSFYSVNPFYPLEISSVSSAEENEILLLTVSKHNIDPVEYSCDRLQRNDVRDTIASDIQQSKDLFKTTVDFAPAIKAAQRRLNKPSLIIESITEMGWADRRQQILIKKEHWNTKEALRATRFHSFLKPQDMKDITFGPSTTESLFDGRFYIGRRDLIAEGALPSFISISSGLVLRSIPKRKFKRKNLLRILSMCLLLFGFMI